MERAVKAGWTTSRIPAVSNRMPMPQKVNQVRINISISVPGEYSIAAPDAIEGITTINPQIIVKYMPFSFDDSLLRKSE